MFQGAYEFADFAFEPSEKIGPLPADLQAHLALTLRGTEIARAVFREMEEVPLSEDHEQQYLRHILLQQFQHKSALTILPKLPASNDVSSPMWLGSGAGGEGRYDIQASICRTEGCTSRI
jgi:hypothetical protein